MSQSRVEYKKMGQYIDERYNLVEGLLEVIPYSFLLSSAFEEDIQKSIFGRQWSLFFYHYH